MKATIADIAVKAGVSQAAVSQVLNGHMKEARISAETALRIRRVAEHLKYVKPVLRLKGKHAEWMQTTYVTFAHWLLDSSYRMPEGEPQGYFIDIDKKSQVTPPEVVEAYMKWMTRKKT